MFGQGQGERGEGLLQVTPCTRYSRDGKCPARARLHPGQTLLADHSTNELHVDVASGPY